MSIIAALVQCQQQVGTVEKFIKQSDGVIRQDFNQVMCQPGLTATLRPNNGIQQDMATQVHQRYQTHDRGRALAVS